VHISCREFIEKLPIHEEEFRSLWKMLSRANVEKRVKIYVAGKRENSTYVTQFTLEKMNQDWFRIYFCIKRIKSTFIQEEEEEEEEEEIHELNFKTLPNFKLSGLPIPQPKICKKKKFIKKIRQRCPFTLKTDPDYA
jgi:hypothetical protein